MLCLKYVCVCPGGKRLLRRGVRRRALVRFDQQRGCEHTAGGIRPTPQTFISLQREGGIEIATEREVVRKTLDYRDSGGLSLGEGEEEMLRWRMRSEIQRNEARDARNTSPLD